MREWTSSVHRCSRMSLRSIRAANLDGFTYCANKSSKFGIPTGPRFGSTFTTPRKVQYVRGSSCTASITLGHRKHAVFIQPLKIDYEAASVTRPFHLPAAGNGVIVTGQFHHDSPPALL